MIMPKTAARAIAPAIAGYVSCQKEGKHGSVREMNAVGNKCTKAVAMSTPVPKCRTRNNVKGGIRSFGTFTTMIGRTHAVKETAKIMNKAPTWRGKL